MNNKKQNTNRFLDLIVNTYGIGGVQLSPLKFNDIRSVVNFFTNILFNIYMVKTFQSPLFKNDGTTKFEEYMLMQFNKFNSIHIYYFHKFNSYILFPLIYYAYTLSYFINGHRLIECFQSTIYLSIQYSKQKSILILSIVMIIQNFIVYLKKIDTPAKVDISTMISFEIFYFYESVTWILLYFHQFANLNILKAIKNRYCSSIEMDIFRESFTLLMFDFFTIDSALFMDWIIFLTGYATIISQTN
uniref:Uncharacterized protein LOC113795151 n=1 Tax=Dermatophagoides pteronyssinus TaxID=6956 RepID=A0A6P6Y759_DERPT|nr:uncharacterized protein LOC113795151 [Dermatophagoides pteronyssinus]